MGLVLLALGAAAQALRHRVHVPGDRLDRPARAPADVGAALELADGVVPRHASRSTAVAASDGSKPLHSPVSDSAPTCGASERGDFSLCFPYCGVPM